MMATRKLTKTEIKRDAIRAAEIFGLTISKNAANTDSVVVSDPSDENGWFEEFGGYDAAYKYLSKVHRDKQDFGTPYPWVTWKEKRQKNPAESRPRMYAMKIPDGYSSRANATTWAVVVDGLYGPDVVESGFSTKSDANAWIMKNAGDKFDTSPPKRRQNPATKLPAKTADVRGAARRYMDFTGHAPGVVGEVSIKIPKAVAVIGSCDGILYTTVRDGKTERYIHEFKKADAPTFTVTPDGKGIFLIGGRYDFTERGIVDASDPTSPRRRRK